MKNPSTVLPRIARSAKRRWAFTLIELLVVVTIIAILVAITVPALTGVRNQALDSKTVGRMRKLGAAYLLYMADNNSVPVSPTPSTNNSWQAGEYWIQTDIAPYVDLQETGNLRFYSTVWWDAFAEINGFRTNGVSGALYYDAGKPPRNQLAGFDFNNNAFPSYTDPNGSNHTGLSRLSQIARLSKTAVMMSRRQDKSYSWNSWSDGRKYSDTNPPSYGARRMIFYFDGHTDTWIINASNYNNNLEGLYKGWATN